MSNYFLGFFPDKGHLGSLIFDVIDSLEYSIEHGHKSSALKGLTTVVCLFDKAVRRNEKDSKKLSNLESKIAMQERILECYRNTIQQIVSSNTTDSNLIKKLLSEIK